MTRPLVFFILACSAALAQASVGLPSHPELDLANARQLVDGAGCKAAFAALDRGGNPLLVQRDNLTGPHNATAAVRKAYTALSTKTPTRQLAEKARLDPEAANLNTLPELLLLGGGVPLYQGAELVGAFGVAGAGGAQGDEKCALDAVARAGFSIQPQGN